MKLEDLEMIGDLGEGAFGNVIKVREKLTNKIYALKIIDKFFVRKTYNSYAPIFQEKEILMFIKNHPNVMAMRASFQDTKKIYILTEFIEGHTLDDYITEHGSLHASVV